MSEFINYLQQHENQLRIVFSTLDQNKDGKVTYLDVSILMQKAIKMLQIEQDRIPLFQIKQLIA